MKFESFKLVAIYLLAAVGGFLLLQEHGVEGAVVLGALAVVYLTLRRGLLAARSFMYLGMLTKGVEPIEANMEVFKIGYLEARNLSPAVKYSVQQHFGGDQSAMITEAKQKGFTG